MIPNQSTGEDMWNNLINNPIPNTTNNPTSPTVTSSAQSSNSSPSQAAGFSQYATQFQGYHNYQNYQHFSPYAPFQQTPPPFHQTPPPFHQTPPPFHQTPPPFGDPRFLTQSSSAFSPFPPTPINYPQFGNIHTPPEPESPSQAEAEPEPVPNPKPKKGKGKAKAKGEPKRVQVRWSDDEALILSERWIHRSEVSKKGVSQSFEAFWDKVLKDYNKVAPQERSLSQLQGKWNKIRSDTKIFIAIYKHLTNPRQSGASDTDILKGCHEAFKSQQNRAFIYEKCWNVLRLCPKFMENDGVMSRQPSQAELEPINLGDDMPTSEPISEPLTTNMERLFQDDLIRRPPGRAKSNKSQKSSGSSDAATSSRSLKEKERLANIQAAQAQQETLATIKGNSVKKTILKSWKMLYKKIPSGLKDKEKKMLEEVRKTVVDNYENDYKMVFGRDSISGSVQVNDSDEDQAGSDDSE
jgi:hypothetical protein